MTKLHLREIPSKAAVYIPIVSRQSDVPIDSSQLIALVQCILQEEKCRCDEVSLQFVATEEISQLHGDYFGDFTATDCISFPIDTQDVPGYRLLGELFICPAMALSYSQDHGVDPYEELSLYVVHGLLHLMGYDDQDEEERQLMRHAEGRIIALLRHKGLLLCPLPS